MLQAHTLDAKHPGETARNRVGDSRRASSPCLLTQGSSYPQPPGISLQLPVVETSLSGSPATAATPECLHYGPLFPGGDADNHQVRQWGATLQSRLGGHTDSGSHQGGQSTQRSLHHPGLSQRSQALSDREEPPPAP